MSLESSLQIGLSLSVAIHGLAFTVLYWGSAGNGVNGGGIGDSLFDDVAHVSLYMGAGEGTWAEIKSVPGNRVSSTESSVLLGDAFDADDLPHMERALVSERASTSKTVRMPGRPQPNNVLSAVAADRSDQGAANLGAKVGDANSVGGGQMAGAGFGRDGSEAGVILRARLIRAPKPPYPSVARDLEFEGSVLMRVEIGKTGRITSVVIERASGCAECDRLAQQTVSTQWLFEPARRNGESVPSKELIAVVFKLEN